MYNLNWDTFDGKRFQKLCNSILFFEVSKFALVYTAEGKDTGIDQYYIGDYSGKKGIWRFQDKFHNSGIKTNDIAELKRDIKTDIRENYKNENYLVFLTNINLSPSKHKELVDHGNKLLADSNIVNCEFQIWHQANLEAILSNNPIVYNWFWEMNAILLQTYKEYFSKQLNVNTELLYQLHNVFVGKQADIDLIENFINTQKQNCIAIVANGGYGKTRLCIEYFKNKVDSSEEWTPLVLSHIGFNASHFSILLNTAKRLIIFIDNAHEIPDVVSEVKRLIDNSNGKHKLILTTRNTLFSEILTKLPSHARDIYQHNLEKLNYDETKELFEKLMPGLQQKDLIKLANASKGVPNIILEFTKAIMIGKQPYEISAENSFVESVNNLLTEAASDIEKSSGINKSKTNDFLKLIAIISPVANTVESRKYISNILEIRDDKVELLISRLNDLGLLDYDTLAIKPDPYSDVILAETISHNKSFFELVRNHANTELYFENILKNLAEADLAKANKEVFIGSLLLGYVNLIVNPETPLSKLKNILEFTKSITYSHTKIAIEAIKNFIKLYTDKNHAIHQESDGWAGQVYSISLKNLTNELLAQIFNYSKFAKDNLDVVHDLLEQYISATSDLTIIQNCYGYRERDLSYFGSPSNECSKKQLFLKEIASKYLQTSISNTKLEIGLKASEVLLKLDFQLETNYEPSKMQFTYGTGYIQNCKHSKEIRNDILKSLIILIQRPEITPEVKANTLDMFLDYFFYSSVNYENRYRYKIDEEVMEVLQFLSQLLDTHNFLSISQKSRILDNAVLFQKPGIRKPFEKLVEEIKQKASKTTSVYEELEMCVRNKNHFELKNLGQKLIPIIKKYASFKDFRGDLIKIQQVVGSGSIIFGRILEILIEQFPAESTDFFNYVMDNHPELIDTYKPLVRANYRDEIYFYSIVDRLWAKKEMYFSTIFWLLTYGRNSETSIYKASDLKYYEYVIDNDLKGLYFMSTQNIIDYAFYDKVKTFELVNKAIKKISIEASDLLLFKLFEENIFAKTFALEIKDFLFENIRFIDIDQKHGDNILSFIENIFGFNTLIEFAQEKAKIKYAKDKYNYIFPHEYIYRNKISTNSENIIRYKNVIEWFMNLEEPLQGFEQYVLYLFQPISQMPEEFRDYILQVIDINKKDTAKLSRLKMAIGRFRINNETRVLIMARLIEAYILNSTDNVDIDSTFGSSFYFYTEHSKGKIGINVPYQEDAQKKEVLDKVLLTYKFMPQVQKHLEKYRQLVQRDIDDEIQNDLERTSW